MESGLEMKGSRGPGITAIINRLLQTGVCVCVCVCGADGSLAPAGEVNPDALPLRIFEKKEEEENNCENTEKCIKFNK